MEYYLEDFSYIIEYIVLDTILNFNNIIIF